MPSCCMPWTSEWCWTRECFQEWGSYIHLVIPSMFMVCTEQWTFEIGNFLAGLIDVMELGTQGIICELASVAYMMCTMGREEPGSTSERGQCSVDSMDGGQTHGGTPWPWSCSQRPSGQCSGGRECRGGLVLLHHSSPVCW
ncbi:uncharacterized protein LOC104001141 isoform X3 [Pan troglodytes]|uniref:uncharacterized protein LOC104001141 isoform X3 n=1 Tax=Pan troglodytes TaxID=9598 RepID=UPI0007DBBD73